MRRRGHYWILSIPGVIKIRSQPRGTWRRGGGGPRGGTEGSGQGVRGTKSQPVMERGVRGFHGNIKLPIPTVRISRGRATLNSGITACSTARPTNHEEENKRWGESRRGDGALNRMESWLGIRHDTGYCDSGGRFFKV
jgi:hypothetical protein